MKLLYCACFLHIGILYPMTGTPPKKEAGCICTLDPKGYGGLTLAGKDTKEKCCSSTKTFKRCFWNNQDCVTGEEKPTVKKEEKVELIRKFPDLDVSVDLDTDDIISHMPLKNSKVIALVNYKIDEKDYYRPYDAQALEKWLTEQKARIDIASRQPIQNISLYTLEQPGYILKKNTDFSSYPTLGSKAVYIGGKLLSIENGELKLSKINFTDEDLSLLDDFIKANKTNIKKLTIKKSNLSVLPDSISSLAGLNTLDLSGNEISALPESIGNLTMLKTLDLSENQLSNLPESIGNLRYLETLKLSRNQLSNLPKSIDNLKKLESLNLYKNQFSKLPESIVNLPKLSYLNLSKNKFLELPESIGTLKELVELRLSKNQLSKLPESIGKLKKLFYLDIADNNLTTLPESFTKLHLQYFITMGNDWDEASKKLIKIIKPR